MPVIEQPEAREEFRVVAVFNPFDHYDGHVTRQLVGHRSISLTYATLRDAELSAKSLRRCHPEGSKATIKEQRIERRLVTEWAEVPASVR